MRANEFITEAFDQPYPMKWEKGEFADYDALATLPDGKHLHIMFNNEGDGEFFVEFYRNNSQEVTGEGDAQRVFSTVLNAIQTFIKMEHPWRLMFSASKAVEPGQNSESRAKLYDRLVQRYANAWGYDMYHEDHGDQVTYELTQLKQNAEVDEDISRRGFLGGLAGAAALGATGAQAKMHPDSQSITKNPKVEFLLKWARHYIKDPQELAAFMAQCAHESDNFNTVEEYGTTERFMHKYDIQFNPAKAKALGNDKPGDGAKYHGRGYLQLTGKYNYSAASKAISKAIGKTVDFVAHPEWVASPEGAVLTSIWYWKNFVKPKIKNFSNTKQVTTHINPGLRGEKNREKQAKDWQTALNVKPHKQDHGIKVASR